MQELRRARLKREARERRWREEREAEARENDRRRREQEKFDLLVAQMERWELASRVRQFVAALRASAADGSGRHPPDADPGVKVREAKATTDWLAWVEQIAARLDPTSGGVDAVRQACTPAETGGWRIGGEP